MYQRAWTVFREFYQRFYDSRQPIVPVPPNIIALFISYLSFLKKAPATIASYLSAIGYVHKLRSFQDPTKTFVIQKLMKAVGRERAADLRLPISRPVLHQIVRSLVSTNSSASKQRLYAAMFLTAFYGFFRVGELTAKSARESADIVQFDDIRFLSECGQVKMIKITIRKFKHNSDNRPFDILIARESSAVCCPVLSLIAYCELRGRQPGPLFCLPDMSPITTSMFNTELKRCLIFCGLDTTRYKSHSFRIGAACYASEQGFSDSQIRKLGRWKSDAFKVYLRSESLHAN